MTESQQTQKKNLLRHQTVTTSVFNEIKNSFEDYVEMEGLFKFKSSSGEYFEFTVGGKVYAIISQYGGERTFLTTSEVKIWYNSALSTLHEINQMETVTRDGKYMAFKNDLPTNLEIKQFVRYYQKKLLDFIIPKE